MLGLGHPLGNNVRKGKERKERDTWIIGLHFDQHFPKPVGHCALEQGSSFRAISQSIDVIEKSLRGVFDVPNLLQGASDCFLRQLHQASTVILSLRGTSKAYALEITGRQSR